MNETTADHLIRRFHWVGERLYLIADEAFAALAREIGRRHGDPANTQLAEIGIGFCGGAQITDCFMEAEAAAGTCHFCFGNNVCYSGENQSGFHGASVLIRSPVFTRLDI